MTIFVRSPHAHGIIPGSIFACFQKPAHEYGRHWDERVILRILTTIVLMLGGRKRGEAPSGLDYRCVCDTPVCIAIGRNPVSKPPTPRRQLHTGHDLISGLGGSPTVPTPEEYGALCSTWTYQENFANQCRNPQQPAGCTGTFSEPAQQTKGAREAGRRSLCARDPDF